MKGRGFFALDKKGDPDQLLPAVKSLVETLSGHPSHSSILASKGISSQELANFKAEFKEMFDCQTNDIINIPVIVNNVICELDSLLALPVDEHGNRHDPIKNKPFKLGDIQPATFMINAIKVALKTLSLQAQANDAHPASIKPK